MRELMELYGDRIAGAISGWDRVRFRGTVRWLASLGGIGSYMASHGILLKDFGDWAGTITEAIRSACAARAGSLGIPLRYLDRAGIDKEALARRIAEERGIDTGDICMFSVVEPCIAPLIKGNRATRQLELHMAQRKCIFIYPYWNDPVVGFGHTRLQTWLPLSATICLNGRHWLERQLLAEPVPHVKDGNGFPFIADLPRAQQLLDEQLRTNWPLLLDGLRPQTWQKMRKGVSDLHRRAQVSDACNKRYAQHLATALDRETLQQTAASICAPVRKQRRTYRAPNPWAAEDGKMIEFIARGENQINGFRNRDLRRWLYPSSPASTDKQQQRRDAGRVTRKLRLLRAHGLIGKVPRTTRYMLTARGRKITSAILAASAATTEQLMDHAA